MKAPQNTTNKNRTEIRKIHDVYRTGTDQEVIDLLKDYYPNYTPSAADKGEIEPIFTGPPRDVELFKVQRHKPAEHPYPGR
jgi:hypothetical protein